jgi:hypothetical protein
VRIFPRGQSDQQFSATAEQWNAMNDAAEWHRFQRMRFGGDGGGSGTEYDVLPVLNRSGADVPEFGVLAIPADSGAANFASELPDRFKYGPLLQSTTAPPAEATDKGRFCIALGPIKSDRYGSALFTGVSPCKIYLHAGDDRPAFADVADGHADYLAASTSGGARVLWCDAAPDADGPVWAVVRLPEGGAGTSLLPFELYDDINPNDTNKYAYPAKSDYSDADTSATQVQVSDLWLGDVRAFGRNHVGASSGFKGARGWYLPGTFGGYMNPIVTIRRLAKMIKVMTPSGTGGFPASVSIAGCTLVAVLDDGQDPSAGNGTITVGNWEQPVCNNVTMTCLHDGSGHYYVIDAPCPPSGGC